MNINYKKGFTLIELLVVIAIIGVLASIILASLDSSRKKGRDARRLADIKQLQLALELYYDQNNSFPGDISNADTCGTGTCAALLTGPGYISVVPTDPSKGTNGTTRDYIYAPYSASGAANGDPCISYHLGADLETSNHTALQTDKDQNDGAAYPSGFGIGRCQYSPSSATGFNGTDTGKCNNLDAGVACYDVTP